MEQVAAMAARHPGVKDKVILDHFAELDITAPPSEGIDKIVALLAPLPNVYLRASMQNTSREPPPYREQNGFLTRLPWQASWR